MSLALQLALGLSVAACAPAASIAPSMSPMPSAAGSSAPIPSAPPASSATPAATPAPSLLPLPEPTVLPAGPAFEVSWSPLDGREAPSVAGSLSEPHRYSQPSAVRFGNGAVVVYSTGPSEEPMRGPMIWSSPDLVHWERAVSADPDGPFVEAHQVVAGGPGVAVLGLEVDESDNILGSRLWVSADGSAWQERSIPDGARFLWGRPGVLVAFGRQTWISSDGQTWLEVGPSPFSTAEHPDIWRATLIDDGGTAIAILRPSFDSITTVYRLTPSGAWEKLTDLPGFVRSAVRGPTGIVAVGGILDGPVASWTSVDGRTWKQGDGVEGDTLAATPTGYVVLGTRSYYQGCDGADPYQQIAQTFTSPDGLTWRHMAEDVRLDHVDLPILLAEDDRLLAIGLVWAATSGDNDFDRSAPSVWETQPFEPVPTHTPLPTAHGCGP